MNEADGVAAEGRERDRRYQREWHRRDRARKATQRVEQRAREAAARLGRPPESLSEWFPTQMKFRTWKQLAAEIGVTPEHLCRIRDGKHTPTEHLRSRLLEITGLPCFQVSAKLPPWTISLLARAHDYLNSLRLRPSTRSLYMSRFRKVLARLCEDGVSDASHITPAALLQNPPRYKSRDSQRRALTLFSSVLLSSGYWDSRHHGELSAMMALLYKRASDRRPMKKRTIGKNQPSKAAARFVANLVRDVGLNISHIRQIQVNQFNKSGLQLRRGLIVPYGKGLHAVSREAFDAWLREAQPGDILFCGRRGYSRHTSRSWLIAAAKHGGLISAGRRPLHLQHFERDFREFPHPALLRLHLEHFHGLRQTRARGLAATLLHTGTDLLPEPYLAAVVAAAQLVDCSLKKVSGGRALAGRWMNSIYRVEVQWPMSLVDLLADGRTKARVGRELLRLALEYRSQRLRLHSYGDFPNLDRSLAAKLELVQVVVSERKSRGRSWEGMLLARRHFLTIDGQRRVRRYFGIPLLEDLWGGEVNGRCGVCQRLDRAAIDDEIRRGVPFVEIAEHHAIAYGNQDSASRRMTKQLLWHAGRLARADGKRDVHVGHASAAKLVAVPPQFLNHIARENATNLGQAILALLNTSTF